MKIAVIDTYFPWIESGFRYWESIMFQEIHEDVFFFALHIHKDEFPQKVYHLSQFHEICEKEKITHIYCVFLNLALSLVGKNRLPDGRFIVGGIHGVDLSEIIKKHNLTLCTTLYPGGGLNPSTIPEFIKLVEEHYDVIFTNIEEVLNSIPKAVYIPGISNTDLYSYNPKHHDQKVVITFCANKGERKGFDTLAKAFNQLDDSFHLNIVGDWKEYLHLLTNKEYLYFGNLTPNIMKLVYRQSHVFINASYQDRFALDGFPTTSAMDAMATGCILVSTNHRNDRFILQENKDYLKFEVGNVEQLVQHLQWISDHFEEAIQIGINGSNAINMHYDARKNVMKKLKIMDAASNKVEKRDELEGQEFNQSRATEAIIKQLDAQGKNEQALDVTMQSEHLLIHQENLSSLKTNIDDNMLDNIRAEQDAAYTVIMNPANLDAIFRLAVVLEQNGFESDAKHFIEKLVELETDEVKRSKWNEAFFQREYKHQVQKIAFGEKKDLFGRLLKKIVDSLANNYAYNLDMEIYEFMKIPITDMDVVEHIDDERRGIVENMNGLSYVFNQFQDEASRELLIDILAFRILGNKKVKLPLNNPEYWRKRNGINDLICSTETVVSPFHRWALNKYNLQPLGYNVTLFYMARGLTATFIDKQYEYHHDNQHIKAQNGQCVIDCGGCWGDTALYFSEEVGSEGNVYTMEFIPSNLALMKKNLALNPHLMERIHIIEHPVWNKSEEELHFIDQGPASTLTKNANGSVKVQTLSIDDLVDNNNIEQVDFIKMDVEGVELAALNGATNTIKKHKPTLAIAVYHQINDFHDILSFIESLNLSYSFYLGHYTIYAQETVLFAVPSNE